jgi:hypothetical protein
MKSVLRTSSHEYKPQLNSTNGKHVLMFKVFVVQQVLLLRVGQISEQFLKRSDQAEADV